MIDFNDLFADFRRGSVVFLGLLCLLVFLANAGLLVWLLVKRGTSELARCPKCGRMIICPHCSDDKQPPG